MSTAKSIGGKGFDRIVKSKWGRFREIGEGLSVWECGAALWAMSRTTPCKGIRCRE
jgi:hypothetical protein